MDLPAVYFERFFVSAGGLISYGPDFLDPYRRAAAYVDRILRGEKTSDVETKRGNGLKAWLGPLQSLRERHEGIGWWPIEYAPRGSFLVCPAVRNDNEVLLTPRG